jgi:hypothetical protein
LPVADTLQGREFGCHLPAKVESLADRVEGAPLGAVRIFPRAHAFQNDDAVGVDVVGDLALHVVEALRDERSLYLLRLFFFLATLITIDNLLSKKQALGLRFSLSTIYYIPKNTFCNIILKKNEIFLNLQPIDVFVAGE